MNIIVMIIISTTFNLAAIIIILNNFHQRQYLEGFVNPLYGPNTGLSRI